MPILIITSIIFLFLSIKYERLALMLLLASLPLYIIRFQILGIPITLLETMILTLFTVFIFKNFRSISSNLKQKINPKSEIRNPKLISYPFSIELTAVLIISFAALAASGFNNSALGIWKAYFMEPIMVYILIFNILFKGDRSLRENIRLVLLPLALSALYVSGFAIYQKFTGDFIPNEFWANAETRRVTSIFGYPNAVALYLGPIAIMLLAYLFSLVDKFRQLSCQRVKCENWQPFSLRWFREMPQMVKLEFIVLKISALLSVFAIYFARSEGALIAMLFSALFLVFFSFSGHFWSLTRKRMLIVFILMAALVLVFAPLRHEAIKRLSLEDYSGQIRKAQWEETGVFLRDSHWFWGAGLAAYQDRIEPYHKQGIYIRNDDPNFDELIEKDPDYQKKHWQALEIFLYPHNIFLNFWVELGLLGMFLFVWIIYRSLSICLHSLSESQSSSRRLLVLLPASAMLVLLVHGIVDVPYFKNDLSVLFWIIIALSGLVNLFYQRK